jgi:hypothetical protein
MSFSKNVSTIWIEGNKGGGECIDCRTLVSKYRFFLFRLCLQLSDIFHPADQRYFFINYMFQAENTYVFTLNGRTFSSIA